MLVGSLIGSEQLINQVIIEAKQRNMIRVGDYIVVTSGLSGTVGTTNILKIMQV